MQLEHSATRVWRQLSREDRVAAAAAFWADSPAELMPTALGAIVKARHLRPQVARALPEAERARALGAILDPGEALASGLLVSLHLAERRPLLVAFLDALKLPHEEGLLKEEADALPPPDPVALRSARAALAAFPEAQVAAYLNTLWLQDPERWGALAEL
ncbi:MAG: hypothetical protein AB7O37_18415 [Vicinamibacteria bacterium]